MMCLLNDFFYPHMLHTDQHRPTFGWSNSAVNVVKFDVYANRSRIYYIIYILDILFF
jgi:hypothetical protein